MSTKREKFVVPTKSTTTSTPKKSTTINTPKVKSFVSPLKSNVVNRTTPPSSPSKTITTTSSPSKRDTPTKKKTTIVDPFNHIPSLEKSDNLNEIIKFVYNINEPVTLKEIQLTIKKEITKSQLDELVESKILIETILNDGTITLYSSLKWYKINQQSIKHKIIDKQNQLEKEEKERLEKHSREAAKNRIVNRNNNIVNDGEKKVVVNHLDKKRTVIKKDITPSSTVSSLKNHLGGKFHSPLKKFKSGEDIIYPLEEKMDQALLEMEQERIKLIASIESKRKQLEKLIAEGKDKKVHLTMEQVKEEENDRKQLEKVKQGCRSLVNRLHVHMSEANKGMDDGLGSLSNSYRTGRSVGFKSSRDWEDDGDSYNKRESYDDTSDETNYNYEDDEEYRPKDPLEGISKTSKLYVIKGYGIDPQSIGYDEDNDDWINNPSTTE